MTRALPPNTAVLTGPPWKRGVVSHCEGGAIHVMSDNGGLAAHRPTAVAVIGGDSPPSQGDEVLFDQGDQWVAAEVLNTHVGRILVRAASGDHWIPPECMAVVLERPAAKAAPPSSQPKLDRSARLLRFGWQHGGWVLLGLAALAPALWFGPGGWLIASAWAAMHVVLAAYVHAFNRALPRFHSAGFGKPPEPQVRAYRDGGLELEHPPLRGKWELLLFLIAGWTLIGAATILAIPTLIASIASIVPLMGLVAAALVYRYDRDNAIEVGHLLATKALATRISSGNACVVGLAAGVDDKPIMWRRVLYYVWSESRSVTKTITDSEGRTQTVNGTQTSTYRCGLRRAHQPNTLKLETDIGAVEVPLRGVIWAAERAVSFGPLLEQTGSPDYRRIMRAHTKAVVREQILADDRVIVVGELRRDAAGTPQMVGAQTGPALVFAAGKQDPRALLHRKLVLRRAMIAIMILVGLAPLIAAVVAA